MKQESAGCPGLVVFRYARSVSHFWNPFWNTGVRRGRCEGRFCGVLLGFEDFAPVRWALRPATGDGLERMFLGLTGATMNFNVPFIVFEALAWAPETHNSWWCRRKGARTARVGRQGARRSICAQMRNRNSTAKANHPCPCQMSARCFNMAHGLMRHAVLDEIRRIWNNTEKGFLKPRTFTLAPIQ